jgi:hypothetical protein
MANANMITRLMLSGKLIKFDNFTLCAKQSRFTVNINRDDASRVISSVFQASQPACQYWLRLSRTYIPNNSTHMHPPFF